MTIEQASWTQEDEQIANCLWRVDGTISDWIFISKFFHGLRAWVFMLNLKSDVLKSKVSLKSGSKTYELDVPSFFRVQ
jgi:hypothetical protein